MLFFFNFCNKIEIYFRLCYNLYILVMTLSGIPSCLWNDGLTSIGRLKGIKHIIQDTTILCKTKDGTIFESHIRSDKSIYSLIEAFEYTH